MRIVMTHCDVKDLLAHELESDAASCTASAWPSPTVYRGRRIESSRSAEPWIASNP
jgi:hypothetical protein